MVIAAVTALLWVLLSALVFAIGAVIFDANNRLSTAESAIADLILLLLATPLVLQIRTLRACRKECAGNIVELAEDSIKIRLYGSYREAKDLPVVAETRVAWCDVMEITKERRKFTYPSLIPFEYPLDVYTIVTEEGEISFTPECVRGAKSIATEIAARLGQDI